MWISRTLEPVLLRAVQQRPVVVVTGARQAGKTSLVRRLLPRHHYVSLDLPSEAAQAERDPAQFLQRHPPPLILDEVQYAPAVFRHLKSVVDARRSENGRFVLAGSQLFPLMSGVSESLAGRAEILHLEGLSYAEAAAARRALTPAEFAVRGGFPELHEKPDLDGPAFYRSYVTTYLERDLRTLLNVGSLRDFERFVRAGALRSAQLLNKAELARDVGVSPPTAAQWLSLLEASGQAVLLEPWFSNRTKSLVKTPKLYLADGGLLCALLGVRTPEELLASPLAGAIWETVVASELRRGLLKAGRARRSQPARGRRATAQRQRAAQGGDLPLPKRLSARRGRGGRAAGRRGTARRWNLNPAVQKPRMTRMGKGSVKTVLVPPRRSGTAWHLIRPAIGWGRCRSAFSLEGRSPKPEGRKKAEFRNPKTETRGRARFGLRPAAGPRL